MSLNIVFYIGTGDAQKSLKLSFCMSIIRSHYLNEFISISINLHETLMKLPESGLIFVLLK
jgi:hypothetical protein